jgi:Tfp pilus assembly protein PilF
MRFVCAAIVVGLTATGAARGQFTTKDLIGDAVSEVGTRYADVDQAIQRFNNKDFPAARQFLEAAKSKDPTLPPTDLILAKMYLLSNNVVGGRASLEKVAMENPGDPEALLILANQDLQQGRFIEAEALYDKAIGLIDKFSENPKRKRNFQINARAGRSAVYERRQNWAAAANDLKELLKVDPDNLNGHHRLGVALFMQKKHKEGFDEFKAAADLDKEKRLPGPWVSAAFYYDQLDQQQQAQKAFDEAIKVGKTDPATLTAYGQWLIKNGSLEMAETVLTEARKANPENLNLLILSGVAARMNKKMKPAEDHFMEALRLSPGNGDTLNQLALLLIDQAEPAKRERALQFAVISSRLAAQSADAQMTLAWVLYQLGKAAEAEQAFRDGLQLGTANLSPDSRYLVAKMLADRNKTAAEQVLKEALEMKTAGIFVNRQEAQALLDSLGS